ncbi:MAG TPA: hypothetical protein VD815_05165 [Candidatus Saccharimonadales bacterium]|nr:hypothetical protein [Candidatus Saccharimonadales bacterium]
MGGNIPKRIKLSVLNDWLSGKSRDNIALNNGISTGKVSNIINEFRSGEIKDMDLLRATAVTMKKEGLELNDLSSAIRLKNMLNSLDLSEEKVEKFLLEMSIYHYKNDIQDPKEFILEVKRVSDYIYSLDVSVFDVIDLIEERKVELNNLGKEILGVRLDLGSLKYQLSELKSISNKSIGVRTVESS